MIGCMRDTEQAMNKNNDFKYTFLMCINKTNPFIGLAIESVLQQTDQDFEFYIIANNCDDALWNHLLTFDDPRIRLHRTLIGQLAFNLNYGANLIKEGYILRMDADDISLPDRLAVTKKRLHENNYPDVMGGAALLIDEHGKEIGKTSPILGNERIRHALWKKNTFVHPTCAIRLDALFKARGYLGGFMSEDYDLWVRMARDKAVVFCNTDDVLIQYRIHGDQARGNRLGYAESAGMMLREAIFKNKFTYWLGAFLGVMKNIFLSSKL